ncbi:hypothetical protein KRR38_27050 [Novosphingobium sp. G106]|uniref:hypothetical protein n=1 Tax=Novosphingobium sp. G106 TaxID=2849500 RepID=UPI001C2CDFAB|nr:hypothetical protein [Novosphingobium sp. G106]MBV1691242.1 hypothetical protein [Novosphingobium sp. G106]
MKRDFHTAAAALLLTGASLTLGSCGLFQNRHVADSRPAPRPVPHRAVAPRPIVEAPPVSSSEAVWGLRAGINVAALSCRGHGRTPVANDYARMLARHRDLLAAAYRQEQGRQGNAFDRQQTRVYNTFANQASPARFCSAASSAAQRANSLDSMTLASAAPRMLGDLRASLRNRP